ncbi:MAG: hypothetical protein HOW73_41640 [Polyangiaceae bacterium]|nr:hypothetical protein [Polyangiaceae bacterium]
MESAFRALVPLLAVACALVATDVHARPAKRKAKKPRTTQEESWGSTPSAKYAALSRTACVTELKSRKIRFEEVSTARGVAMPVRLKGPLGGVTYRTELPSSERTSAPHEVMDCRLVLALHDLSAILVKRDIEEVHMFSAWRPPPKSWPADKHAIRHPGALAIDIRRFVKKATPRSKPEDLVVLRDWKPARDKQPCTAEARASGSDDAKELRAIFCDADDQRLFTSMLSPNYDKAHENHFHLEIRPDVKWRLVL